MNTGEGLRFKSFLATITKVMSVNVRAQLFINTAKVVVLNPAPLPLL
jgi:hypothetical protein